MFRFIAALILLLVSPCLAQPKPESSIVSINVQLPDGSSRKAMGIVVKDGYVISALGPFTQVQSVSVRAPGSEPRIALGLAAYSLGSNLCLLNVEWLGPPPPEAPIAESAPAKGSQASLFLPDGTTLSMTIVDTTRRDFAFSAGKQVGPTSEGQPLFAGGVVVGLCYDLTETKGAFPALRPELLRALKPGPTVPWSMWGPTSQALARAMKATGPFVVDGLEEMPADKLIKRCRTWLTLEDSDAIAWMTLALAVGLDDKVESLAAADNAILCQPNIATPYEMRATIMLDREQPNSALSAARRARELNPDRNDNRLILAMALLLKGDLDEAVGAIHEAQRIDPDNRVSRVLLDRISEARKKAADSPAKIQPHGPTGVQASLAKVVVTDKDSVQTTKSGLVVDGG